MLRTVEGGPSRTQAIHDAFLSDPQHSDAKSVLRELAIAAPDHIYEAAVPVYHQLRAARDMLADDDVTFEDPEYQQVIRPFFAELDSLQRLMRDDLQPPASRHIRGAVGARTGDDGPSRRHSRR
ncbi:MULTISPECIES: hypothetical protein [unclassified Streptomyces]|uniref:hypothetical protein n=1 Tax=unclassified Streptomyces TaxID=2593676 RepID=UPI002E373A62|nr:MULTISPECIES: hypothetical protein [unclassified Streptomyces]WUC65350.1 hypothetical protein OG861_14435 [Streptomyces sp. NBC_00539]